MASDGTLNVEVDVKSVAPKFWNSMRDSTIIFPKAFPHDYKSIEVLEGDGKAVGSVRLITYSEGKLFDMILATLSYMGSFILLWNFMDQVLRS